MEQEITIKTFFIERSKIQGKKYAVFTRDKKNNARLVGDFASMRDVQIATSRDTRRVLQQPEPTLLDFYESWLNIWLECLQKQQDLIWGTKDV